MSALRAVLTADTHLPKRAGRLPEELWAAMESADLVVHAGDWVSLALLEEVESRVERLVGVHGNNDGADLRARLPEVARETVGGVRLAVVHETGPRTGREERCAREHAGTDLLVFGHSHIPWDSVAPGGLRLLNPGSPTDRRKEPYCTYMTLSLADGEVHDLVLHRLPPR